jgi:hypothetical protein
MASRQSVSQIKETARVYDAWFRSSDFPTIAFLKIKPYSELITAFNSKEDTDKKSLYKKYANMHYPEIYNKRHFPNIIKYLSYLEIVYRCNYAYGYGTSYTMKKIAKGRYPHLYEESHFIFHLGKFPLIKNMSYIDMVRKYYKTKGEYTKRIFKARARIYHPLDFKEEDWNYYKKNIYLDIVYEYNYICTDSAKRASLKRKAKKEYPHVYDEYHFLWRLGAKYVGTPQAVKYPQLGLYKDNLYIK